MLAAAGQGTGIELLRRIHLRAGQGRGLADLIERGIADETLRKQSLAAAQRGIRVVQIDLGLPQVLLGHRRLDFAQLTQPGNSLQHRQIGLLPGRPLFVGCQFDQQIASLDGLPFKHRYLPDGAGDLRADVDPVRCLDMTAGDHRLNEIAPHDGFDSYFRALPPAQSEPAQQRERRQAEQDQFERAW